MLEKIYIVNHTHWDREWYRTFDDYLAELKCGITYLINMLDRNEIENFYFDGQTIVLEDIETVLSDQYYAKLIQYIKSGKIEIGPSYILPDEFLMNGEDFVNNINIGKEMCDKYGQNPSLLYMADTFGHISQLPQIAKGFNFNHTLIHRGAIAKKTNVKWKSPDSSNVNAIVLPLREGYYQTIFHLPINQFIEGVSGFIERNEKFIEGDSLLILNGCDHTFIPSDFQQKIDLLKASFPNVVVKQVTMSEYLKEAVFSDEQIIGEQRGCGKAFLLPGVLSTRIYLKQHSQICSDKIRFMLEPITALLSLEEENSKSIYKNTKRLTKNFAHDSICGCSLDKVHKEMEVRYDKIESSVNSTISTSLNEKSRYMFSDSEAILNDVVSIFNHLPRKIKKIISIEFAVPSILAENKFPNLKGVEKYNIVDEWIEEVLLHNYNTAPSYQLVKKYKCDVLVEIEALSFLNILIDMVEIDSSSNLDFEIDGINTYFKGYKYISDAGDSYSFSPVGQYENAVLLKQTTIDQGLKVLIVQEHEITLGQKLNNDRKTRIVDEVKEIIITKMEIDKYTKEINYQIEIDNKLSDIKIVAVFEKRGEVFADTAFDLIERSEIEEITYRAKENNEEVEYNQYPSLTKILNGDMQIGHIGLNELEVNGDEVYITMLRATDSISRRDLEARKGGAGPSYLVPENQVIRTIKCNLNVKEVDKYDPYFNLLNHDFVVHQGTQKILENLPFMITGDVEITRIKIEKGQYLVRLFNYNDEEVAIDISTDLIVKKVKLNNEVISDVGNQLAVNGKEIITLTIGE